MSRKKTSSFHSSQQPAPSRFTTDIPVSTHFFAVLLPVQWAHFDPSCYTVMFIYILKKRHQFHNIPQHHLSHEGLLIVFFSFNIIMEITLFREVKDRTSHGPWLPIANCSITRCYVPITFHWHPLAFQL